MTFISLSKKYSSLPEFKLSIDKFDPKIFQLKYFMHCMSCSFCHDICCHDPEGSVLVDKENVQVIKNNAHLLATKVSTPVESWFDSEIEYDENLPSKEGHWVNTRDDDSCVFLNKEGRGCQIHSMCLEEGLDYHTIKPTYCWLFPLEVVDTVLGIGTHPKLESETLICMGQGETLYRGVREEVRYLFGEELVAELDSLEKVYEIKAPVGLVNISKSGFLRASSI